MVFGWGGHRFWPANLSLSGQQSFCSDAYSILKTGRDEYGQPFPLAFRSFDDYKPPLYIYMTVPSVAVFGLNEFAVRFPSALLGILAIPIVFFLTRELLDNLPASRQIGLLSSFLLAISPWHIQFTRTAYETGSNAFFTGLGLLLFLKGLKNKWFLVGAGIVFGLQTYLYQASKVFVPMLLACLLVIFFRRVPWRQFIWLALPLGLLLIPVVITTLSPTGILRVQGTSIFQDPKPLERYGALVKTDWLRNDNKSVLLFHPKVLTYFQDILAGYLSHFRPDFFLVSNGDPKVTYVPQVGLMNLWVYPFFLAGFYFLFKRRDKTAAAVLVSWFLIAPIPAAVTIGLPNSVRSAVFLPDLQIIAAYGLFSLFPKLAGILKTALFLAAVYLFAFYVHMLFVHAPVASAQQWYYGYKQMVEQTLELQKDYKQVYVSTDLDQPQIFYLFYLKYDPQHYLNVDGGTKGGGFDEQGNRFANYYFRSLDFGQNRSNFDILFVGPPKEFPTTVKPIKILYDPDGQPFVYFVKPSLPT
ncbi:MAG: glycosyltransferase family 39 protein [Patescibacteria group bacterium]|nr:glycosyltransferase family 39 protein [Patescibacteria group bacterium]